MVTIINALIPAFNQREVSVAEKGIGQIFTLTDASFNNLQPTTGFFLNSYLSCRKMKG
jgi:hypothetical protein